MAIKYLLIGLKGIGFFISGIALTRLLVTKARRRFKENDQIKGKTFIITGGNSGIGKALVQKINKMGGDVILIGREEASSLKAIEEIKFRNRYCSNSGKIFFKKMNLNSFKSIEFTASEIIKNFSRVNVLINNAAVMQAPFSITEDGFENHMSSNHLGHALFTILLLPLLTKSGSAINPSRIVFVTSSLYTKGTIRDIDFLPNAVTSENFVLKKAYSNSKLASFLFAKELAEKVQNHQILVNLANPGMAYTNLGRHMHIPYWKLLILSPLAAIFLQTPFQGSQTILYAAASKDTKNSNGKCYYHCAEVPCHSIAKDNKLSQNVYHKTLEAIKQKI